MDGKRIFDVTFAILLIAVTLPLWVVIMIVIKLDSPGSLFYKGKRVGKDGKFFYLYKFRSMVMNADKMGGSLTAESDPRQTRVGRLLRQWKLDELPNFINVLKGEMSIVGPRPESPEYVQLYTPQQMAVLTVKSGITDMSVAGKYRNEQQILDQVEDPDSYYIHVIMPECLALNLEYVHAGPSLWLDFKIILQTVYAILFGHKIEAHGVDSNKDFELAGVPPVLSWICF